MEGKNVKIIGISIKENFGILKATELTFNDENHLVMVKGEVGAGKTSLTKALELTTQGSQALGDKTLYGDHVNLETQLVDGDKKIFIGCKSDFEGNLAYTLYTLDENGKKVKDPIIDGVKATPATYMKNLQTALTWRLNELTSDNPTIQRNILLELYAHELEKKGVVFDKKSPKYVGNIIDEIEKAKEKRSLLDMKRKEVGGIADDMSKKGIDYDDRRVVIDTTDVEEKIKKLESQISLKETNVEQARADELNLLKIKGSEINQKLRVENDKIIELNRPLIAENEKINNWVLNKETWSSDIHNKLKLLLNDDDLAAGFMTQIRAKLPKLTPNELHVGLLFSAEGSCISKEEDFTNEDIKSLLREYKKTAIEYKTLKDSPLSAPDTEKEKKQLNNLKTRLQDIIDSNKEALSINAYHNWKDQNDLILELNKDYFMKLTEIETGVDGLYICPEYYTLEDGTKIAKGNDIYLMYDGSYDPKYFNNKDKEIRKLSSYSDTQKPVICLLIQNYLLSKKPKKLPYLWIDQVPIDLKTRQLLEDMSKDLNLWLFVNWTGDFNKETLENGEIMVENGEIFFRD